MVSQNFILKINKDQLQREEGELTNSRRERGRKVVQTGGREGVKENRADRAIHNYKASTQELTNNLSSSFK
jgi:hypothetical protein